MYAEDSFFTLSELGQVGLLLISTALAVVVIFIAWRLTQKTHLVVGLLIVVLIFAVFEWLSPQIYYFYYIFLFDVPWQIVVQSPPTPSDLFALLTFRADANLSNHSRGLLGWVIILISVRSAVATRFR